MYAYIGVLCKWPEKKETVALSICVFDESTVQGALSKLRHLLEIGAIRGKISIIRYSPGSTKYWIGVY